MAETGNASDKLAGADYDTHNKKQAGTDKIYAGKDWTPECDVVIADREQLHWPVLKL